MEWVKILSSEAEARRRIISGKPQLVVVGEKRIAVVLFNDMFYAIQDACTHNSESLSKGRVNAFGEIVCPWHGYRFDVTTGNPADSSCMSLTTYPVRVDESGLYIGIV